MYTSQWKSFSTSPPKFFSNFVTLFSQYRVIWEKWITLWFSKKSKIWKNIFDKNLQQNFDNSWWKQSCHFRKVHFTDSTEILPKYNYRVHKKLSKFCWRFFTKIFFQIFDFFENHEVIHFPHIALYCVKMFYKVLKKFRIWINEVVKYSNFEIFYINIYILSVLL